MEHITLITSPERRRSRSPPKKRIALADITNKRRSPAKKAAKKAAKKVAPKQSPKQSPKQAAKQAAKGPSKQFRNLKNL